MRRELTIKQRGDICRVLYSRKHHNRKAIAECKTFRDFDELWSAQFGYRNSLSRFLKTGEPPFSKYSPNWGWFKLGFHVVRYGRDNCRRKILNRSFEIILDDVTHGEELKMLVELNVVPISELSKM